MEFGGGPANHRDVVGACLFHLETVSSGPPFPAFCQRDATWDALGPYGLMHSRIHFQILVDPVHLMYAGRKAVELVTHTQFR